MQFSNGSSRLIVLASLMLGGASQTSGALAAALDLVADGFDTPSNIASATDGTGRIFVLEQFTGKIRIIENGRILPDSFLEIGDRLIEDARIEEGLLGLALPPESSGQAAAFVTYTGRDGDLVLSRFRLTEDGRRAAAGTEEILFRAERDERVHHCGHIAFGPKDGKLYLCIGDTQKHYVDFPPVAQDLNRPQGKILRFDVGAYGPSTAPPRGVMSAAAGGLRAEIVAYGLRNPWRFGFDPATGDLFLPDVGRRHWEELNVQASSETRPANYGWPLAEGNECLLDCSAAELVWPEFEYARLDGRCAVIGGEVYRGPARPAWHGVYVFADWCSGEIWALRDALGAVPQVRRIAATDLMPTAIDHQADGEILIADAAMGGVYALRLPEDFHDGWQSVDQVMWAEALEAKRSRFGYQLQEYRKIVNSRRWQIADYLGRMYRSLRNAF